MVAETIQHTESLRPRLTMDSECQNIKKAIMARDRLFTVAALKQSYT